MHELATWTALAYRTALNDAEKRERALGAGPDPQGFDPDLLRKESADLRAMEELGAQILRITDEAYPGRLRDRVWAPVVLSIAGRKTLLDEGTTVVGGIRGAEGARLQDLLDRGERAVLVLNKGMLKARSLLHGLREAIEDGAIAVVSMEPPRASWGPLRDRNRDRLFEALAGHPRGRPTR